MKTNEILQGNRILAEFMGLKPGYNSYTKKYNWGDGIFFMTDGDTIEEVMDAIAGYAKYHSSWDWLMPVVEKIEALGYDVEIGSQYVRIDDGLDEGFGIDSWNSGSKIEAVFTACVEFAKWYKNQTK
jgi:hypothetical protein